MWRFSFLPHFILFFLIFVAIPFFHSPAIFTSNETLYGCIGVLFTFSFSILTQKKFSLHSLSIIHLFQIKSCYCVYLHPSCSFLTLPFLVIFLVYPFFPISLPLPSSCCPSFSSFFPLSNSPSLFSHHLSYTNLFLSATPLRLFLSVSFNLSLCKLSPKDCPIVTDNMLRAQLKQE